MSYADTLYAVAIAQERTSAEVRAMTRVQVANACGVTLPVDKTASFLYWNIKKKVARRLDADAVEFDKVAINNAILTFAENNGLTITRWQEGDSTDGLLLRVRRAE